MPSDSNLLTLFEYGSTNVDALSEREGRLLDQITRTSGCEVLKRSIKEGKICFKAQQYVGVVRLGRRTVQILPKIHRCSTDQAQNQREAAQNLLFMLSYAGNLGIRETGTAPLNRRTQDFFEVLIYLFANNLQQQWLRGAARSYEAIDAVLPVLKGKWRIGEQLCRPEQKHRFHVTYDEFTEDNTLNRILRYVVECLWKLTRDSQNRTILSELRCWMDGVTLLPVVTPQMAQTVTLSRLNRQYEPLLNLACLFLNRLSLDLSANDQTSFSFVFDMNKLFEEFLTKFIQRHRQDILPPDLQDCELLPQGRQAPMYLARHNNIPAFRLKPDLVFRQGTQFPLLIDFKYKILNSQDRKLGISEADFYQMHAYLQRFQCPQSILVYPQTAEATEVIRSRFALEGDFGHIKAVSVNLIQNLASRETKEALMTELRHILEFTNE